MLQSFLPINLVANFIAWNILKRTLMNGNKGSYTPELRKDRTQ